MDSLWLGSLKSGSFPAPEELAISICRLYLVRNVFCSMSDTPAHHPMSPNAKHVGWSLRVVPLPLKDIEMRRVVVPSLIDTVAQIDLK